MSSDIDKLVAERIAAEPAKPGAISKTDLANKFEVPPSYSNINSVAFSEHSIYPPW